MSESFTEKQKLEILRQAAAAEDIDCLELAQLITVNGRFIRHLLEDVFDRQNALDNEIVMMEFERICSRGKKVGRSIQELILLTGKMRFLPEEPPPVETLLSLRELRSLQLENKIECYDEGHMRVGPELKSFQLAVRHEEGFVVLDAQMNLRNGKMLLFTASDSQPAEIFAVKI